MRLTRAICAAALMLGLALGGGCAPDRALRTGLDASPGSRDTTATPGASGPATGDGGSARPGGTESADTGREAVSGGEGSGGEEGASPESKVNPEENLGNDILVYVTNTARTRVPEGTEIRLGKSVYRPDIRGVMDQGRLGPLHAGKTGTLLVYPDGLSGKRIEVSIKVPRGDAADRLRIVDVAIADDSVRVLGASVLPESRGAHARF